MSAAAIAAGSPPESLDTFFRDDENHEKSSRRVCPPQAPRPLSSNPASRMADRYVQNSACLASACMAAKAIQYLTAIGSFFLAEA